MDESNVRRILLVEDQTLVRAGMRALIQMTAPRAHLFEAGSYEAALRLIDQTPFDVAFLDFDLKEARNGLDLLRTIRERSHDTHVIMLSAHDDKNLVLECIHEGASGYILKDTENDAVFRRALDTVFQGAVFLPASVIGRGGHTPAASIAPARASVESFGLSGRLVEVLYYCCQGLPNKAIANKLGIAEGTVRKDYMTRLFRVFKVARRTELLIEVSRRGLRVPRPAGSDLTDSTLS